VLGAWRCTTGFFQYDAASHARALPYDVMPLRTSIIAIALLALNALTVALAACGPAGTTPQAKPAQKAPPAKTARPGPQPTAAAPGQSAAPATTGVPRGKELYAQMCAVCHGERGEGYKADQATALAHPDFLASASDAFIRRAITHGRRGTTMSAWARERGGPLARTDVDALVAFMRSWDTQPRVQLDERPIQGDPARGQVLYARDCARCHGAKGIEGPNVRIADRDLLRTAGPGFLRHAVAKGRAGTTMPGFEATLGERGIDDVLAYVQSVQSRAPADDAAPRKPPPIPLGPVPLNPRGPEPIGFKAHPGTTKVDVVHAQLKRRARMVLLDARAPSDYALEHIAGAVSVPFYDPTPYLKDLPKDAWLVSYCACPHAESMTLARKLVEAGFKKVTVLDEGLNVWKARNYGVRTGVTP
jgi:cytochrome c oxidase cbb3-type subunit 3/ubiquinol-cytochrome c reductase cytochrome c subunit